MHSKRLASDLVKLVPEFWVKVDDWYEVVFESWKFGLIPLDLKPGTAVDGLRKFASVDSLSAFPGLWAKEGTHILLSTDKQYLRSMGPSRSLPNPSGVRESTISLDLMFQYEELNPSFAATLAASTLSSPDKSVPNWMREQVAVHLGESAGSRISSCLACFPEYFADSVSSPSIGYVKRLSEEELGEVITERPSTVTEIFRRLQPGQFGPEPNLLLNQLMVSKFVHSSRVEDKLQFQSKR